MSINVDLVMKRFVKSVKDGEDVRKLHSILSILPKEDFMSWTDRFGQNALHYSVLSDNSEAVDLLLKMGYFAPPHEPIVNMYAHLAARLGYRAVLITILLHRPQDFKVAEQPLFVPPDARSRCSSGKVRAFSKQPEVVLPGVTGNQVYLGDKRCSLRPSSYNTPRLSRNEIFSDRRGSSLLDDTSYVGKKAHIEQGDSSSSEQTSPRLSVDTHLEKSIQTTSVLIMSPITSGEQRQSHRKSSHQRASLESPASRPRRDSIPTTSKKAIAFTQKRRNSSPEESLIMDDFTPANLKPLACTPLEVAARYNQLECVRALLDMYVLRVYPDTGKKGYITLAALANDVTSLKLMLLSFRSLKGSGSNSAYKEDYRAAVEVCLRKVYPQCLDALLAENSVDPRLIFRQVNFFHVLYSPQINTGNRAISLSRLPDATSVLIARGHDVKAKIPPRTYPLYTLIDNVFSCNDFAFSEYYITCMKLLMEHGADPNFDEIDFEKSMMVVHGGGAYFGRPGYSSGLHCVIECVETYRDRNPVHSQVMHFAEECLETLIGFDADIEQVGRINGCHIIAEGDVLCQFAKISVKFGLDKCLLRCLVKFGAEPQRKIRDQYALNTYFDQMCAVRFCSSEVKGLNEKNLDEIQKMINLMCGYMAPWHIKEALEVFVNRHNRCTAIGDQGHERFKLLVISELDTERRKIRSLRNMAAWQVWKLCKRRSSNVRRLPVSKEVKTNVLPLVLFQTMW